MPFIAPIVEGHGEVEALPILLRRIAQHAAAVGQLRVNPPIRVKSGSFLNDGQYFNRYIQIAAAKATIEQGLVLILLDCDDGCPATLGPDLLARARAARGDVEYLVALAYREFETWFVASAQSLAGYYGVPANIAPPANTDGLRDAKGWLGKNMNCAYDPITHQFQFAKVFDLEQARTNHSFNRFYERVRACLDA